MRVLSAFTFATLLVLEGCCNRDGSFYARMRGANDTVLRNAIAAKGLTLVPVLVDHSYNGSLEADPWIMVVATAREGRDAPQVIVVRDAENVVHVVRVRPKKTVVEQHRVCGCPPGGGVPPPVIRWYVRLENGAKAGEPIDIEVDEWQSAQITYSETGAKCAVP